MPVPGIPTPIAFFRIFALKKTSIVSGAWPKISAALADAKATAIGSVHPIAGITSRWINLIICSFSILFIS